MVLVAVEVVLVVDMDAPAAVALLVVALVALPFGVLEVVLEGETEVDIFAFSLRDACFPKVAPSAPPRAAPNTTRKTKRPIRRFLREQPRDSGDTVQSSFAAAASASLEAPAGGSCAPSSGRSPWSND